MAAQPDIDALLPLIRFRLALLIIAALNLARCIDPDRCGKQP
jgi:hypothetical protein